MNRPTIPKEFSVMADQTLEKARERSRELKAKEKEIQSERKKWKRLLTGKCLNCNEYLERPARIDLTQLDLKRCEDTGYDDKCYITGIICKNVKLGDQNCRTLKVDDTWRHTVARLRMQGKIIDKYTKKDGTFNQRKFNCELKKHGITPVKESVMARGEVSRERYFFLERYNLERRSSPINKFCSDRCKKEYHRKKEEQELK